jgi:hypothetical protein
MFKRLESPWTLRIVPVVATVVGVATALTALGVTYHLATAAGWIVAAVPTWLVERWWRRQAGP